MTISSRKFGVELELVHNSGHKYDNFLCYFDTQTDTVGGYDWLICKYASYFIGAIQELLKAHGLEGWDARGDGSIKRLDGPPGLLGVEVVSPPLSGEEGLAEIRKVCEILKSNGFRVNLSCGLHVHVDTEDLDAGTIINVSDRYRKFDDLINKWMISSRNENKFCKKNASMGSLVRKIKDLTDRTEIISILYNIRGRSEDRYRKVNLLAVAKHGTVEFRHHHGTVNATEVENWVRFCVGFVEASKVEYRTSERTGTNHTEVSDKMLAKFKTMAELISDHRASVEKLARVLEVSEASVPAYVSALRAFLGNSRAIRTRRGNHWRTGYYWTSLNLVLAIQNRIASGTTPTTQSTVQQTLAIVRRRNDNPFINIPEFVKTYYETKTTAVAA